MVSVLAFGGGGGGACDSSASVSWERADCWLEGWPKNSERVLVAALGSGVQLAHQARQSHNVHVLPAVTHLQPFPCRLTEVTQVEKRVHKQHQTSTHRRCFLLFDFLLFQGLHGRRVRAVLVESFRFTGTPSRGLLGATASSKTSSGGTKTRFRR